MMPPAGRRGTTDLRLAPLSFLSCLTRAVVILLDNRRVGAAADCNSVRFMLSILSSESSKPHLSSRRHLVWPLVAFLSSPAFGEQNRRR